MGIFDLIASLVRKPPSDQRGEPQEQADVALELEIPYLRAAQASVTQEEVDEAVAQYRFVLEQPPLAPVAPRDAWWNVGLQERRVRAGSGTVLAWVPPFLPLELVAGIAPELVRSAAGPFCAKDLARALRAAVRERRKLKQPQEELLRALYGACVLADLLDSLIFEYTPPRGLAEHITLAEIQALRLDYADMGYQHIKSLGKTDVKWLVEAFGEPASHHTVVEAWAHVRQNAIRRMCWQELEHTNPRYKNDSTEKSMQQWLERHVRFSLSLNKEHQEHVQVRLALDAQTSQAVQAALAALSDGPFVVADLETTGLQADTDEILEFAAVRASPDGQVTAEFGTLVRIKRPLPSAIEALTGITERDISREGRTLAQALDEFLVFVGELPVFFHNAPFDTGFIQKAVAAHGRRFANPVHDTLELGRKAWPRLASHKLADLASHVGASTPTHRALADARATLTVALAARAMLSR
jgi:DNA polymerase-3 subunit epsilon